MTQERKVSVLRTTRSLIEEDFGSIDGQFEAEMAKMAEEMARFRSHLMLSESKNHQLHSSKCLSKLSTSSYSTSTTTTSTSSAKPVNKKKEKVDDEKRDESSLEMDKQGSWLEGLNSPLIKNSSDEGRILSIRFDVRPYEPEQIIVKTVDNLLMVHAELEQNGPQSKVRREYNREFLLPEGTKLELIRSSLSADGVLTVEAPLP